MQGGNPAVVLESTPNGAQGYFYELCMEALDGSKLWRLHFFPWWHDLTYRLSLDEGEELVYTADELRLVELHNLTSEQIKWRRSKQAELKHLFIQEYPEDPYTCFLVSGNSYFGDVSQCFFAPFGATHQPGHEYVAGLDFAQTGDYLAFSVIDRTANMQVDLLRINQLPWGEMRRQVREKCKRWHVKILKAEANSMGTTNIEAMREEFEADGVETEIIPFDTTNRSKIQIAADLHEALHEDGLGLLDIPEQKAELKAFRAKQTPLGTWQMEAGNGQHDDIVIADMLANNAAMYGGWYATA
jgi:phage FluMu gp28-like protein